jgi:hypothetical protein
MGEVKRTGYLAAYDVSDTSRRQRIWQRVQAYAAELGQRSAHVIWLTPAERRALLAVVSCWTVTKICFCCCGWTRTARHCCVAGRWVRPTMCRRCIDLIKNAGGLR